MVNFFSILGSLNVVFSIVTKDEPAVERFLLTGLWCVAMAILCQLRRPK